jgi:chaperonin GroES
MTILNCKHCGGIHYGSYKCPYLDDPKTNERKNEVKIVPISDQLLVRRDEPMKKSAGGILIPEAVAAKEKPAFGVIIACGEGFWTEDSEGGWMRRPLEVKAGDRILFSHYAGTQVPGDDPLLYMMREKDVVARIEPDEML